MSTSFKSVGVLVTLVVQNATLVLMLRFSFRDVSRPYSFSLVLLLSEFLKLLFCVAKVYSDGLTPQQIISISFSAFKEPLVLIPSCLYFVQNSLQFVAARELPAVVYIVLLQLKVLTSAVFSVFILKTQLSRSQWFSLALLVFGAVTVQAPAPDTTHAHSGALGAATMIVITGCSGLAGVLLEKVFKKTGDAAASMRFPHSVWSRNIQLTCCSLPFVITNLVLNDWDRLQNGAMMIGLDMVVSMVILLLAFGGIITGYVMKYASAVLKCFAGVISMCCCAIYSVVVGEKDLDARLLLGIALVNASVLTFTFGRRT